MKLRKIAGALALLLTLGAAGCAAEPAPGPQDGARPQRRVVDEDGPQYAFAPESPAIDAALALPGGVTVADTAARASREVRAVWISYLEMEHMLQKKSESQFTANIARAFDNIKGFGLNTVIVHVRPFADALYRSDYFPWSYIATGTEGKDPGFDPLAVMVREAKARGLEIEAWINPYRVRSKNNANALAASNQAKKWLDGGSPAVCSYDGALSYNPASKAARELIVNGAVEIVEKYGVDGIHIDDYFYPSTDAGLDKGSYGSYQNAGGKLSLADWRRQNVCSLVEALYKAVKAADQNVRFGISPQSSLDNNYNAQYFDVEKAVSNGWCDYICPQIYFGYANDAQPYKKTLDQWSSLVKGTDVGLWTGLAAYKIGLSDTWAGSGKDEWAQNRDMLSRMVADARGASNYQGFVLYRYDSAFDPAAGVQDAVRAEMENLGAGL